MVAFATVDDLAAYLGESIPPDDPTALLALELASASIQAYTRQTLEAVYGDSVTLRGFGRRALLLPELPVNDVSFVMIGVDALVVGTDYVWDATGVIWRAGTATWGGHDPVSVTYDHGYDPIPDPIRTVCVQAAARSYGNPAAVVSETIGNYSVSYDRSAPGVQLSEAEQAALDGYRYRGLA